MCLRIGSQPYKCRCFAFAGDSGYPLEPWLLTPVAGHPPDTTPEGRYNNAHASLRGVVERCIGLLKARFRCLQKYRALHHEPGRAALIVSACAALHNICVASNEPEPVDNSDYSSNDDSSDDDSDLELPQPLPMPPTVAATTRNKRRAIFARGKALRDSRVRLFAPARAQLLQFLRRVRHRLHRQ